MLIDAGVVALESAGEAGRRESLQLMTNSARMEA
jgi:hypothetical protein